MRAADIMTSEPTVLHPEDRLERAVQQVAALLDAEGLRPRREGLAEMVFAMRRDLAKVAGTALVTD